MEYQMNEIIFLISVAWAERELLHSASLFLWSRPRLYYLLPTLEKYENWFCSFDIPRAETQSVQTKFHPTKRFEGREIISFIIADVLKITGVLQRTLKFLSLTRFLTCSDVVKLIVLVYQMGFLPLKSWCIRNLDSFTLKSQLRGLLLLGQYNP